MDDRSLCAIREMPRHPKSTEKKIQPGAPTSAANFQMGRVMAIMMRMRMRMTMIRLLGCATI